MDSQAGSGWKSRLGRAAALALGVWFLVTGVAKTLDPVGFAAVIEDYGIVTGAAATRLLAWGIITGEIAVGSCLLLAVARRAALGAATGMLVVFTLATARAWASGQLHDCGCFGPLLERTPGQTLVQDLILIAIAALAFLGRPAPAEQGGGWRPALALAVALGGVLAPPVVARFAPPLEQGETLESLGLDTHLPWNPPARSVFAFLDPLRTGAETRALDALAGSGLPAVALCTVGTEAIEAFRWAAGPSFEIVSVPRKLYRRLSDDRPGAFLVVDGRVADVWRGRLPAPEEALAAAGGVQAGMMGEEEASE